jgi:transposase, IS30 family
LGRDNTTLHKRYCLKLRTGRRIRKSRWLTRTGHGPTIANKTMIDQRPASAETKLEAGHWEGDLVRHEALQYRAEVRDLRRRVVAAA